MCIKLVIKVKILLFDYCWKMAFPCTKVVERADTVSGYSVHKSV